MAHFGFNRNCCVTRQSSRTELHFRHRVSYSSGWIASPATRDCLSWHWISWRLLPLKLMLNDYSRCVVARKISDSKKGNSAIADKPARRVYRSVNVTKHSTIPYVRYSFLLCNCNLVFKTRFFYDIPLPKMSWPWNRGHRSLKVIESGTIR